MRSHKEYAAKRLAKARLNYERDPSPTNQRQLERAEEHYVAAQNSTKPYYKERKV